MQESDALFLEHTVLYSFVLLLFFPIKILNGTDKMKKHRFHLKEMSTFIFLQTMQVI